MTALKKMRHKWGSDIQCVVSQVYCSVVPLLPKAWLTSGTTTGKQTWTKRSRINSSNTCRNLTSSCVNEALKQRHTGRGSVPWYFVKHVNRESARVSVPDRWAKTNYTCQACMRALLLAWLCRRNYVMPTVAFTPLGCLRELSAPLYHFLALSVSSSVLRTSAPF